jgi:hypothetical protein
MALFMQVAGLTMKGMDSPLEPSHFAAFSGGSSTTKKCTDETFRRLQEREALVTEVLRKDAEFIVVRL